MSKSTTVFLGMRKHPPFATSRVALSLCLSLLAATPAFSSTSGNIKTLESTQQQKQTITGVVKDTHGDPVIGASVMVNGVAMAVTDVDGNFSLSAAPGAVLQVSYVGFKPQSVTVRQA